MYRILGWLKELFGSHTRYGLVANYGAIERLGFVSEKHATHWALRNKLRNWVTFQYDTRERLVPALHHSSRRPLAPLL